MPRFSALILAVTLAAPSLAQNPPAIRPIPPPGVAVPDADRGELEAGLKDLAARIEKLRSSTLEDEVPNVEIYHKAVDWALRHNEIFDVKQIPTAKEFLKQGLARVEALERGDAPWNRPPANVSNSASLLVRMDCTGVSRSRSVASIVG